MRSEKKKNEKIESSEKRKVGGGRCERTVSMSYERNASETHKKVVKKTG